MNRLQRTVALLAAVVALSTISPNRARAQDAQDAGWCFWACGLTITACCFFAPELCEVCSMGTEPCINWCSQHYPGGA